MTKRTREKVPDAEPWGGWQRRSCGHTVMGYQTLCGERYMVGVQPQLPTELPPELKRHQHGVPCPRTGRLAALAWRIHPLDLFFLLWVPEAPNCALQIQSLFAAVHPSPASDAHSSPQSYSSTGRAVPASVFWREAGHF
ncbi:hypothetical protein HJG60_011030 [Phyllostomus discolor]|uniref:Uncharacterized protein n=1 Tax=Phyllostomus discolor TaxID=89673 RepID=A0A834ACF1_9CHIR|nr:hypothetical protein HJG60_011030 [Phyllostomus discolor]